MNLSFQQLYELGGVGLKAFIEITRPHNCLMGGLTSIIGVMVTRQFYIPLYSQSAFLLILILSYFTYIFIAAAGNVINDVFDIEIDRINRPDRPIPSGVISINQAKIYSIVLWLIGIIFSFISIPISPAGFWCPIIAIFFSFIGFAYAAKGKVIGIFGNFMVAISFSFGYIYGGVITGAFNQITSSLAIITFFLSSFFMLQSREIIKGMEDVEGDRLRQVKTIAMVYGHRAAAMSAAICGALAIVFFTSVWLLTFVNIWFIPFLMLGDISVAVSILILLSGVESSKKQHKASLFAKIGAFFGLVGFLIGTI
ncbi:MAG: geranylgeranylglycerol-phosphate geranylgeranyltransferase [Promethearchaeota archaeon]